jgi:hypothetical protein
MAKKSPRYAENFPKSFSLSGGAVGWFKDEIDAWLEACAANPKGARPSKKAKPSLTPSMLAAQAASMSVVREEVPKRIQKFPRQSTSRPEKTASQPQTSRTPKPRNLAETIVDGSRINARLLHYVRLKSWTPAMGALLISGIEPPMGCTNIPVGGVGLDEKTLHGGHERFQKARSILDEWQMWSTDANILSIAVEPSDFLIWCVEKEITSEWFRLILELTGCADEDTVDLTASRFALLTGR